MPFSLPDPLPWESREIGLAFLMWSTMMAGMMLPSVYPWIRALARKTDASPGWPGFLGGYFVAWTGFSAGATGLQWGLSHLSGDLDSQRTAAASVLMVAGLYQWTPWKQRCLVHCRSPIGYFLTSWKDGRARFFRMGLSHGLFCVGCCWALMLVSLVAGVMNLWWMALMSVFVFVDHTRAIGRWLTRAAGLALVVWAGWLIRAVA